MTRTAVGVGVALLIALDAVLAVLAWQHVHPGDVRAGVVEEIADPANPDTAIPDTPTQSAGGGDIEPPSAYDAAVAAGEALARVPVRSCDAEGPATIELSEDGGASFREVTVPLAGVRSVRVASATELVAVGTNRRCRPVARRSGDGGESWQRAPLEEAGWGVVGDGGVMSPAGELRDLGDFGCAPVVVSGPTEEDAVTLCESGSLLRTENGGSFWGKQATLPSATDVVFLSGAAGYALVERADCPALVRGTSDGGVTWRDLECLEAEPPAALAADDDVLVVLTADTIHRSEDGGQNWDVY